MEGESADARRKRLRTMAAGGASKLKFRNYRPQDTDLKNKAIAPALPKPILDEAKTQPATDKKEAGSAQSKQATAVIQKELKEHVAEQGGEEVLNIAPRKPNWDLKRDVAKKMEKLNKRTQLSIVDLIKERIEREAAEEDDEDDEDDEEGR